MSEKSPVPAGDLIAGPSGAAPWLSILMLLLCAVLARPALAQEFSVLGGLQHTSELGETTYAWSYEYVQNLSDNFYATFDWLNEGHVTNHHRDGHSLQLWYRWLTPSRTFSFSGGLGPYRYYDTTSPSGDESGQSTDEHGVGIKYSATARWYFGHPWVAELQYDHVQTQHSISTDTLMLGFGYEFDATSEAGPTVPAPKYDFSTPQRNEVTLAAGKSILNDFNSPQGAAWAIEYRRRITPYLDIAATGIDEGENGVTKRRGLAVSATLSREFLEHQASIGLGLGPYVTQDLDETGQETRVLGLLTMVAKWRITDLWSIHGYWYRTVTTNGRDTDVMLIGMGYSF
jgi:hypothetical protein